MMTRSVRRNGRTGSGNGSLQEKPIGAEEEKMRGQSVRRKSSRCCVFFFWKIAS
jgi:hypothetical protein